MTHGATGKGIASITKTGTSGLVDTYTITFTDGTTTTYTVTNGEDGEVTQAQLDEVIAENNRIKATFPTTGEETGEIVTLDKTAELQFAKPPFPGGNTKQTGTPSPNSPVTIDNVTGNVNATVSTINRLAYPSDFTETYGGSTITQSKGIYTISGAATGGAFSEERSITNYTIKANDYLHIGNDKADTNSSMLIVFSDSTNITKTLSPINYIVDLTSYVGKTIVAIRWYHSSSYSGQTIVCKPMIVNNVNTTTSFVEHKSQAKTFPLGAEKMCMGDYLADDGIHHVRKQIVLNGTENWIVSGQRYLLENAINAKPFSTFDADNPLACSSHFVWGNGGAMSFEYGKFWYTSNGKNISIQKDENPNATTLADFKTWLSSNNVTIEYELATEDIMPYTSEQQTAYNEIKKMLSYEGQTNVYSTNTVSPIFDVEAYQAIKLLLEQ